MASIIKKIKKGKPYYYAVESKRVNGKPRIVWQKYLGTVERIVERTQEVKPPKSKETVISDAGGVAALLGITQRLNLLNLINEQIPKREQGPSVGHYLILAALNRALAPCSKMAIADWYEETVLPRLWRFPESAFSSQRFWDHMNRVSDVDIHDIEDRLLAQVKLEFGIDSNILLYDTTNFFTFVDTSNHRAGLPQRGHSKAKRHDLRQVGLALLVTRDFQIPLLHRTYNGNIVDVTLFPKLARELIERYQKLTGDLKEAVLVFDKGNVSDDAMERLTIPGVHFVAALSANRLPELLSKPEEEFEDLPALPGTKAAKAIVEIWGKTCQGVVVYTESYFTQQLAGVTHNLVKCQKKLSELAKRLKKWHLGKTRGKRPTVRGVKKRVKEILKPQFMKDLINVQVEEKDGLPHLKYALDHAAFHRLTNERLGRTLLITDQLDWSSFEVVQAYRNLAGIEETFKNMKNLHFLRWQPAYHWTDQKLKVHGFYCFMALLLAAIARKETIKAGIELTLPALLAELTNIREVAVIYPPGTLAHRKDHITLSRMTPRQRKLAEILRIAEILH
jgi:transposase